jgi:hypothetical protein
MDTATRHALEAAVQRLLRPLVRLLLRHAVPFAAFERLAKQVYVDVALNDFSLDGKRATQSRASVLTGLTRKDVQRIVSQEPTPAADTADRHNRATRVMTAWVRDPDFLAPDGRPDILPPEGEGSFAQLVKRYSGDMPPRAVLDELLRVGAVRRHDDGGIEALAPAYVPQQGAREKLAILGVDVADLIGTIAHNLEHGAEDPRFQRKVMYQSMPAAALPAFRALSAREAQALLEKLDGWLAAHDDDLPSDAAAAAAGPRVRVGVGIHYFEEPLAAARSPGDMA